MKKLGFILGVVLCVSFSYRAQIDANAIGLRFSGGGFGSSLWIYGTNEVHTEHGMWTKVYSSQSSNFSLCQKEFWELKMLRSWFAGRSKIIWVFLPKCS